MYFMLFSELKNLSFDYLRYPEVKIVYEISDAVRLTRDVSRVLVSILHQLSAALTRGMFLALVLSSCITGLLKASCYRSTVPNLHLRSFS